MTQSRKQSFLEAATVARKAKDYKKACSNYDAYLTEMNAKQEEMTIETGKVLVDFAYCIIEDLRNSPKNVQKNELIHLQDAVEYLLTAREILGGIPNNQKDFQYLIDTFDFLGDISLMTKSFEKAISELLIGSRLSKESPVSSWRITTNFLLKLAAAFDAVGKVKESVDSLKEALEVIVSVLENEKDPETKLDLADFKFYIEQRINGVVVQ